MAREEARPRASASGGLWRPPPSPTLPDPGREVRAAADRRSRVRARERPGAGGGGIRRARRALRRVDRARRARARERGWPRLPRLAALLRGGRAADGPARRLRVHAPRSGREPGAGLRRALGDGAPRAGGPEGRAAARRRRLAALRADPARRTHRVEAPRSLDGDGAPAHRERLRRDAALDRARPARGSRRAPARAPAGAGAALDRDCGAPARATDRARRARRVALRRPRLPGVADLPGGALVPELRGTGRAPAAAPRERLRARRLPRGGGALGAPRSGARARHPPGLRPRRGPGSRRGRLRRPAPPARGDGPPLRLRDGSRAFRHVGRARIVARPAARAGSARASVGGRAVLQEAADALVPDRRVPPARAGLRRPALPLREGAGGLRASARGRLHRAAHATGLLPAPALREARRGDPPRPLARGGGSRRGGGARRLLPRVPEAAPRRVARPRRDRAQGGRPR